MSERDIYIERTNLRTILTAIFTAVLGVCLLYLAANWTYLTQYPSIQSVIRELGGLVIASIALALLWELAAKRAFLSELMSKARLAEDVRSAGLINIVQDFYRGIEWPRLIKNVTKFDVFFAYGRTWRNTNNAELLALARRHDIRVRIVLPDPDNQDLMSELARRFSTTTDEIRKLIEEASSEFIKIFGHGSKTNSQFSLWYLSTTPVFSFYRFDSIAILALYRHTKVRGQIPTFVVEQGGTIYDFIRSEFDEFIKEPDGLARKVYPVHQRID